MYMTSAVDLYYCASESKKVVTLWMPCSHNDNDKTLLQMWNTLVTVHMPLDERILG